MFYNSKLFVRSFSANCNSNIFFKTILKLETTWSKTHKVKKIQMWKAIISELPINLFHHIHTFHEPTYNSFEKCYLKIGFLSFKESVLIHSSLNSRNFKQYRYCYLIMQKFKLIRTLACKKDLKFKDCMKNLIDF